MPPPPTTSPPRALFREYADALPVEDLEFQGFARELEEIRAMYGGRKARLLLARDGATTIGCVALRRNDDETCEMKRLYVRSPYRGSGVGRRLAEAIIDAAREIGYRRMKLDTLPSMRSARALYAELGFVEIEPYYETPIAGTSFMQLDITDTSP